MKDFKFFFYLQ